MKRLYPVVGFFAALTVSVAIQQPAFAQKSIEEIVVTATKRARSIQDVDIAMTAFSAKDIADFGWNDVTQVASQSPNVEIKYVWGNSMPVYTIRGVGMNGWQASDTPSVGLYIDEIFQTSLVTMGAHLYDIERVEVLRGPQGALFGRNANGGAVSYFSKRPSQEFDASARLDYGNYNRFELEAAVGGALSDTVSARLSLLTTQQGEGHITNRVTGAKIGEVDISAARAQLLWEPTEETEVLFKVFWSSDRSQPRYFTHIGFWTSGFATGTDLSQQYCSSWMNTGIPKPADCVDLFNYSDTDGNPYVGDYTNRPDTVVHDNATLKNDNIGATLTITHDFNDLTFTSLTSAQDSDRFQPKESDAIELLFVDFLFASAVESFSQEFRLASNYESRFNWMAGALYSTDDASEDPPRILYADDWIGLRGRVIYAQDRTSIAAYAQGEFEFSEKWRLSAGARYINEQVDFTGSVAFLAGPPDYSTVIPLSMLPNPATGQDGKLDDSHVIGRVALNFMPSDDTLIYGSVATGYKGGGFNGGFNSNQAAQVPFFPEEVLAFELGVKATFADGRAILNAAAFTYDYDNLQSTQAQVDPNTGTPFTFVGNLATADVSGFEAELHWVPTEQLELMFGAAFLDTKNTDPFAGFDGALGNAPRKLANSPESSFNLAASYDVPMDNGGSLRFFTDYNWQDDHYKEIVNNIKVPAQSMWNARVTWFAPGDRWSIAAWGKNLSDEVWIVDTLADPVSSGWGVYVHGLPRTYGLSAQFNWGE